MSSEPHAIRNTLDDAFRFMCLNHTLLSYISTLGAHRENLVMPQTLQLLDDAICYIDAALHHPDIDVQTQREGLLTRQQQLQQLAPRSRQQGATGLAANWSDHRCFARNDAVEAASVERSYPVILRTVKMVQRRREA